MSYNLYNVFIFFFSVPVIENTVLIGSALQTRRQRATSDGLMVFRSRFHVSFFSVFFPPSFRLYEKKNETKLSVLVANKSSVYIGRDRILYKEAFVNRRDNSVPGH